ncbi:MAG TPA: hypothetical protein VF121_03260 [Thermoanaerobaculia bacterium]|nr:hypothetical protein [Thermoanaerobaculia bacterium]
MIPPRRAALVLFALLAACGKEGPPSPPLQMVPAPAQDLTVAQRGPQLLLELAYPQTTPGGVLLGGISGVEVWEVVRPAPREGAPQPLDPRQLEPAATLLLRLQGPDLAQAAAGDRLLLRLPAPPVPAAGAVAHHYVVRTLGPEGDRSAFSNQAILLTQAPPPAPEELNVTPTAEGVEITWRPPSHGGERVQGFNVYRREATARDYGKPLATLPPTATRHLDTTARFGTSAIYTVTTVGSGAPLVESAVQAEREVRYLDRFAPPPPADLVALAETGRVRLVWRSSPAADIAGYAVFRREGSGSWRRLTADPVAALEYSDSGVAAGRTYRYRVIAVDQEGNESDAGPEAQATVP